LLSPVAFAAAHESHARVPTHGYHTHEYLPTRIYAY
jgi:hypothetical protein